EGRGGRKHPRARSKTKRDLQSWFWSGALIQRADRCAEQMSRHKISARLHREPARPLPKLHRSGLGQGPRRARLSAAVFTRTRRGGFCEVAAANGKIRG